MGVDNKQTKKCVGGVDMALALALALALAAMVVVCVWDSLMDSKSQKNQGNSLLLASR